MALRSRKGTDIVPVDEQPTAIVAAAERIIAPETQFAQFTYTDQSWQREAWGFYDCNGELHYAAEYVGSATQMVRTYIRHVLPNGELGKEVEAVDDPEVYGLGNIMLGGPAQAGEVMNSLGTSLTIAGECYLIGRRINGVDEWVTVAPQFVRPWGQDHVTVDFGNGKFVRVNTNDNFVIRIWTRHRARPDLADAPTRALLISFAQLQKLRMFMSAELNSRIANGVLYPLPDNLKFLGDPNNNIPAGAPGVAQLLFDAMTSNISGYGTAAQVAPIIFEAPAEAIAAMKDKPIRFDSPLSDHAMDYRRELIDDVARGMNVPAGTLSASAMQGLNHWSAWWGSEEFITKTIAPMMMRICDALTRTWLRGQLVRLGKDPERFTVWYDVAPLSNTANQIADALNIYNANPELISADTVRAAANYNDSNKPDDEEIERRHLWDVVKRDPTLLHIEGVREKLGLDIPNFAPPLTTGVDLDNPGPPPPPAPDRTAQLRTLGRPPERRAETDGIESSIVAPSLTLSTANAVVLAALAVAGRRLRTAPYRSMFNNVDPTVMHTKIRVTGEEHAQTLLASAWTTAAPSLEYANIDPDWMLPKLNKYATQLMCAEVEHTPGLLAQFLAREGVVV